MSRMLVQEVEKVCGCAIEKIVILLTIVTENRNWCDLMGNNKLG